MKVVDGFLFTYQPYLHVLVAFGLRRAAVLCGAGKRAGSCVGDPLWWVFGYPARGGRLASAATTAGSVP